MSVKKKQGKKNDSGKPSVTLIPTEAILGMAKGLTYGAIKYGVWNYRDGIAHRRLLDASLRHLLSVIDGEVIDKESGNPHIWHALASLAMYEWMRINRPDLNDLYKKPKKKKPSKPKRRKKK